MDNIKKKRGRPRKNNIKIKNNKKKTNISDIKSQIKEDIIVKKSLLVHLKINTDIIKEYENQSFESEYLNYNNIIKNIINEPLPFEENNDIIQEEIKIENENKKQDNKIKLTEQIKINNQIINKNIIKLIEYDKNIDMNNNIVCWWCSHNFNNKSFGIPYLKENGKYKVKGYFCSLNCSKAYNNYEDIPLLEKQNRNNLIDLLNYDIQIEENKSYEYISILTAPPREVLKIYGGYMTIDEFRKNNINIKIIYPPIITIIPEIEELKIEKKEELKLNKNINKNKHIKSSIMKIF